MSVRTVTRERARLELLATATAELDSAESPSARRLAEVTLSTRTTSGSERSVASVSQAEFLYSSAAAIAAEGRSKSLC